MCCWAKLLVKDEINIISVRYFFILNFSIQPKSRRIVIDNKKHKDINYHF